MEQAIKCLRKIVTRDQILTDPEDLYVYSFERLHEPPRVKPSIVIRTLSAKEISDIAKLACLDGFSVVRRGDTSEKDAGNLILVDDVPIAELKADSGEAHRRPEEGRESLEGKGYGTLGRLAFAFRGSLLKERLRENGHDRISTGYCTVAPSFNGVETWSSKGRLLIVKGVQDKEIPTSKKVVDVVYTCTGCGLCFADRDKNLELNKAIMATRNQFVESGLAPDIFRDAAKSIIETGSPSGTPSDSRQLLLTKALPKKRGEPRVLYWVGCMVSERAPATVTSFLSILEKGKIEFTTLGGSEGCCGYLLLSTGLWEQARTNAEGVLSRIKATHSEVLVTPCAGCFHTFKNLYPEILDISLPCEILHSSQIIERLIERDRLQFKALNHRICYHDPCSLGRHSGVFDPPRNVLKSIPDLELVEMQLNRQLARCCGGGGGLWSLNHRVSANSAYQRLTDLKPLGVETLATSCPLCQLNFRHTILRRSVPARVCDITEIVSLALR